MNNLHFLPNNIFTRFFKELTKCKNDYISIVYIYIYIYTVLLTGVGQHWLMNQPLGPTCIGNR